MKRNTDETIRLLSFLFHDEQILMKMLLTLKRGGKKRLVMFQQHLMSQKDSQRSLKVMGTSTDG